MRVMQAVGLAAAARAVLSLLSCQPSPKPYLGRRGRRGRGWSLVLWRRLVQQDGPRQNNKVDRLTQVVLVHVVAALQRCCCHGCTHRKELRAVTLQAQALRLVRVAGQVLHETKVHVAEKTI